MHYSAEQVGELYGALVLVERAFLMSTMEHEIIQKSQRRTNPRAHIYWIWAHLLYRRRRLNECEIGESIQSSNQPTNPSIHIFRAFLKQSEIIIHLNENPISWTTLTNPLSISSFPSSHHQQTSQSPSHLVSLSFCVCLPQWEVLIIFLISCAISTTSRRIKLIPVKNIAV